MRPIRLYGRLICMPPATRSGLPSPFMSAAASVIRCVGELARVCSVNCWRPLFSSQARLGAAGLSQSLFALRDRHVEIAVAVEIRLDVRAAKLAKFGSGSASAVPARCARHRKFPSTKARHPPADDQLTRCAVT